MDARFIDEERADNTARSLLPIHYFAKRRGAKASGSFLQHGHCSEIFVWFNERAWVDPFDSTEETLLLTFATDKTCTLYANSLMGSEFIIVFPFEQPEFTTSSNPYI